MLPLLLLFLPASLSLSSSLLTIIPFSSPHFCPPSLPAVHNQIGGLLTTPLLATFTVSARSFKVTPSRHPTFLHPSLFPHPHSLAWSEDGWEWLGLWWQRWQELSDRFYGSGGHEGNEPWPRGWDLPPPPPAGRWPESRTPAVAATRGFRRLTAQDVSSLGPYLVKVFRDSVIRLQGGGGPGSVPGERAAAPAFLKSASPPPTPGSPLREGPQGWPSPESAAPQSPAAARESRIQACAAGGWRHRALQRLCHFSRPPRC